MDLFPEESEEYRDKYGYKKLLGNRKTQRKSGNLWAFYRYYKNKRGFGERDEKEGTEFLLVDDFNSLDDDIKLEMNGEIKL